MSNKTIKYSNGAAYRAGYSASADFYTGETRTAPENPYTMLTPKWFAWREGEYAAFRLVYVTTFGGDPYKTTLWMALLSLLPISVAVAALFYAIGEVVITLLNMTRF